MEASATRTRGAARELQTAQASQRRRSGNRLCCALLLALFIFILAVAIINAIL